MSPRLFQIVLQASERIVRGGTQKCSWRIAQGDDWLSVKDIPGAEFERLDAGPGVVWKTQVTLRLPEGTRLAQTVESPKSREKRSDPLSILRRESQNASGLQRIVKTWVIDQRGLLVRSED